MIGFYPLNINLLLDVIFFKVYPETANTSVGFVHKGLQCRYL